MQNFFNNISMMPYQNQGCGMNSNNSFMNILGGVLNLGMSLLSAFSGNNGNSFGNYGCGDNSIWGNQMGMQGGFDTFNGGCCGGGNYVPGVNFNNIDAQTNYILNGFANNQNQMNNNNPYMPGMNFNSPQSQFYPQQNMGGFDQNLSFGNNSQPFGNQPFNISIGTGYQTKATSYFPDSSAMEGGYVDRKGAPLNTLQDYLEGKAEYVSVAMDSNAFNYGQVIRIPELEAKYGRPIEFRVVDTGGAFKNQGTSRIDICTRNSQTSVDPAVNRNLTLVPV